MKNYIFILFALIVTISWGCSEKKKSDASSEALKVLLKDKKWVKYQKNLKIHLDTAHVAAVKAIKSYMKEPNTFREISNHTSYIGKDRVYIADTVNYWATGSIEYQKRDSKAELAVHQAVVTFDESMYPSAVYPIK